MVWFAHGKNPSVEKGWTWIPEALAWFEPLQGPGAEETPFASGCPIRKWDTDNMYLAESW